MIRMEVEQGRTSAFDGTPYVVIPACRGEAQSTGESIRVANASGIVEKANSEDGQQSTVANMCQHWKLNFVKNNRDYGYGYCSRQTSNFNTNGSSSQFTANASTHSSSLTNFRLPIQCQSRRQACRKGDIACRRNARGGEGDHDEKLLIDSIRERDFPQLLQPQPDPRSDEGDDVPDRRQRDGLVYLDHAGATLFGASQLKEAMHSLLGTANGNPHSQGPVSSATAARIDSIRLAVLAHFGADPREWKVVFTSGATGALKMVGEQFPWSSGADGSLFAHARESHNSVLGMREYALASGARVRCLDLTINNLSDMRCGVNEDHHSSVTGSCCGLSEVQSEHSCSCASACSDNCESEEGECTSQDLEAEMQISGDTCRDECQHRTESKGKSTCSGPVGVAGVAVEGRNADSSGIVDCLFAFPAECNATGVRTDLSVARRVKAWGELHYQSNSIGSESRRRCSSPPIHVSNSAPPRGFAEVRGQSQDEFCKAAKNCCDATATATQVREVYASRSKGDLTGCQCRSRRVWKRRKRWWVMLDAAKYVGTAPLDLSKVDADFVALSFYKMFGYPTGLGALLLRDNAAAILRKRYFGGGTVEAALAGSPFQQLREEPERRLSDGTENFLGILSLKAGFRSLESVGGMRAIAAHTHALACDLHAQLSALRHENSDPVLRFFGGWDSSIKLRDNKDNATRGGDDFPASIRQRGAAHGDSSISSSSGGSGSREGRQRNAATAIECEWNLPKPMKRMERASNEERSTLGKSGTPLATVEVRTAEKGAAARRQKEAEWMRASERAGVSSARSSGGQERQGPVITMVFLRPGGEYVGHTEVEKLAALEGIQLRTGCFCNPGACQAALDLSDGNVMENLEKGHVCWDDHDLIDGRPTGLVRVSLGWMSSWEDTAAFVTFVRKHFVCTALETGPDSLPQSDAAHEQTRTTSDTDITNECTGAEPTKRRFLEAMYIYPIKSCAPQRANAPIFPHISQSPMTVTGDNSGTGSEKIRERHVGKTGWPVGWSGLAYDREWAVVDCLNRALRLKQAPEMCKIRPSVDLRSRTLTVSAPGMPDLVLPLDWGVPTPDGVDSRSKECPASPPPSMLDEREQESISMWPWSSAKSVLVSKSNSNRNTPKSRNTKTQSRSTPYGMLGSTSRWQKGSNHCNSIGVSAAIGREREIAIVRVCGNRRVGISCEASASAWFTRFLGVPCSLVRAAAVSPTTVTPAQSPSENVSISNATVETTSNERISGNTESTARSINGGADAQNLDQAVSEKAKISAAAAVAERAFANEAPFLLISRASVAKVNATVRASFTDEAAVADERLNESTAKGNGGEGDLSGGNSTAKADGHGFGQVTTAHFRPNFVVNGVRAHEEDGWQQVVFGDNLKFQVTGPCSRCSMINIDPETGDTSGIALRVLAGYRRQRANILFGQFLSLEDPKTHTEWVWEGMEVSGYAERV